MLREQIIEFLDSEIEHLTTARAALVGTVQHHRKNGAHSNSLMSTKVSGYWARMSDAERSKEMKRRLKARKKTLAKKAAKAV